MAWKSYKMPEMWLTDEYLVNTWLRTKIENPKACLPKIKELKYFYDYQPWLLFDLYRQDWTIETDYAYFMTRPYRCLPSDPDHGPSCLRYVHDTGYWKPTGAVADTVVSNRNGVGELLDRGLKRLMRYYRTVEDEDEEEEEGATDWKAEEFTLVHPRDDRLVGNWVLVKVWNLNRWWEV